MTRESNEERVRALHARMVESVSALTSGAEWVAMLGVAARFHTYSPRNVLLILVQRPDATRVAGYRVWQGLGRQVRKGEKGIAIFAPIISRTRAAEDPDGDGEVRLRGFRVVHVFDLAQTDGDPLPDVSPTLLSGAAPAGLWAAVAELVAAEGYTIARNHGGQANGSTNPATRVVEVRAELDPAQAAKTLIHELAHIRLGHVEDLARYQAERDRCEVEAESVAHIVGAAVGLATEAYSFPYVGHWAGADTALVATTAEQVITAARAILAALPTALTATEAA
jgi:antirestriction protein ArdC